MNERVHHPAHYGSGSKDPYEHHKVVRAWNLNYFLGNATKYICRAGRKPGADDIEDLRKALWYLNAEIIHRVRERAGNSPKSSGDDGASMGVNDNHPSELTKKSHE